MKKRNLLSLLMLATLTLASCGGDESSVDNNNSTNSEDTGGSENNSVVDNNSNTENNSGSENNSESDNNSNTENNSESNNNTNEPVGTVLAKATFEGVDSNSKALPEGAAGWTYIPNNASYPEPKFNKDGFKFAYVNQAMESPTFNAQSKVSVNVLIGSLNAKQNLSDDNGNPVLTFTALDTANSIVDTKTINVPVAGDNIVTLEGNGIVKVNIKMTNIYSDGGSSYNIKVTSFEVKVA